MLDRVDRAAKPRNDLAHGLWTWASWAPGDLLVIRPADFAAHLGAIQATRMAGWALNGSGSLEDRLTVANEHPKDNTPGRGTFDVQRVNPYNLDELRRLRTYAARVQDLLDTMREAFEAAPARANEARKHADQLLQTPSSPFA